MVLNVNVEPWIHIYHFLADNPTLTAASTNQNAKLLHRYSRDLQETEYITPGPQGDPSKEYYFTETVMDVDVTSMVTETVYDYNYNEHGSLFDEQGSGDRTSIYGRPGSQGVYNFENLSNRTNSGNISENVEIQIELMKLAESAWREQLPPGTMSSEMGRYLMTHSAFPVVRMAEKGPVREWVSINIDWN